MKQEQAKDQPGAAVYMRGDPDSGMYVLDFSLIHTPHAERGVIPPHHPFLPQLPPALLGNPHPVPEGWMVSALGSTGQLPPDFSEQLVL